MKVIPGTVAFEAVAFLRITGCELVTAALAASLGRSAKRLPKHLAPAVRAGLISRRVVGGAVVWSRGTTELVAPPKPIVFVQPGPLAYPSVFHYAATFQDQS